ncbi:MAG: hypothetical protein KDA92_04880 [Planctomycetales bacterium]|nr:hypothetical protein [Planctomycetales bacterium]
MIQRILQSLVIWYADADRPLPHWLQSRIRRDEKLAQFAARVTMLESRLRSDAKSWTVESSDDVGYSQVSASHDVAQPNSDRSFGGTCEQVGQPVSVPRFASTGDLSVGVFADSFWRRNKQVLSLAVCAAVVLFAYVGIIQFRKAVGPAPETIAGGHTHQALDTTANQDGDSSTERAAWVRDIMSRDWNVPLAQTQLAGEQLRDSIALVSYSPTEVASDIERATRYFVVDVPMSAARMMGLAAIDHPGKHVPESISPESNQ